MGKGKGGGTPCSGDPFGVDCEFGVGFEDLEEELWGWLAWGLSRKAGVGSRKEFVGEEEVSECVVCIVQM